MNEKLMTYKEFIEKIEDENDDSDEFFDAVSDFTDD